MPQLSSLLMQNNGDALHLLEQAVLADPKNPLPKYQKANVLVSDERYEDALKELEFLNEVAPRESSVFFLMGKIYKRLNMPEQAMHHFCIALDLKPSSADVNLIKVYSCLLQDCLFANQEPCSCLVNCEALFLNI